MGLPEVVASRRQAGFTLTEMLVASAILGVIVIAVLHTVTTQQRVYTVIDQVSDAEQNGRALSELLERDLRHAGYLVPPGAGACGLDSTTGPDTLFLSDADVIVGVDQLPEDLRTEDLGATVQGVAAGFSFSAGSRNLVLDQLYLDLAANGDDFRVGAGLILADRSQSHGNVSCGTITGISGSTVSVDFVAGFGPVGSDPDVVAIPAHVYTIDAQGALRRDAQLLAQNIEDLQVAWFFDDNDDQQIDPGEFRGVAGGAVYDPEAASLDGSPLREVRVSVVVATADVDPRQDFELGRMQITENRTPASTAGADGKRRRVRTAAVHMRNGAAL